MATKSVAYPPDDLDSLKGKRKVISGKIEALRNQIRELEAKDMSLERMIFEREDGRLAKAAREAMMNDPVVKKAIDHVLEKLEIGGNTRLGVRRGRPPRAAAAEAVQVSESAAVGKAAIIQAAAAVTGDPITIKMADKFMASQRK